MLSSLSKIASEMYTVSQRLSGMTFDLMITDVQSPTAEKKGKLFLLPVNQFSVFQMNFEVCVGGWGRGGGGREEFLAH